MDCGVFASMLQLGWAGPGRAGRGWAVFPYVLGVVEVWRGVG